MMRRNHTYFDRSARKALAIVFMCLFFFQSVGFFHATAATTGPSLPSAAAETIGVTLAAVAGEHCDRLAHQDVPDHGQCHHAGFCPFCSQGERDSALGAPPPSLLIDILVPDEEPSAHFVPMAGGPSPLPSSSGLDESRYATAPPRA